MDADRAGHEVLKLPEVEQAARDRWGDEIFGPDGHVVRSKLAGIVFAPTEPGRADLQFLERLTHSKIGARLEGEISELEHAGGVPLVVLDAAVLLKGGWNRLCDKIVYVEAPREARLERALGRGWTREEFVRREAAQEPLELKRKLADVVLDNSGSPDRARAEVERVWQQLMALPPPE